MDPESKLISLITQLLYLTDYADSNEEQRRQELGVVSQILSLVNLLDLDSQPKPESQFTSLVIQSITLFKSMNLDSQPKPLSKLISFFTELMMNPTNSDSDAYLVLSSLIKETLDLKPEPELISLIYQILTFVGFRNYENLISVCPQVLVSMGEDDVLYIDEEDQLQSKYNKWECLNLVQKKDWLAREGDSYYFYCRACNGQNHESCEKAIEEIKHSLHPKHSLKLALLVTYGRTRKCYCCDEDLCRFIYSCTSCDFAINIACVDKPPVLYIHHPKWHEHPLSLFLRTTSLTCDVCALVDSTSPLYICPPCGFVVHRRCIYLPCIIRISRHPHRISFTPSFNKGNWSCGVCRKKIYNDYGGYSCIKNVCLYAVHSKCATQSNVWDGIELEGVSEDDTEDVDPFVRISDGIIQHFSHKHHNLKLDENMNKDYEEDKMCQACFTPIYFGKLYVCMQCDFILHEECANLPRKMYHPIHPHLLTLVQRDDDVKCDAVMCSVCPWYCAVGLFYKCNREECAFEVHVRCSVVSEPLLHASHMHPLFLTSKPGEWRNCSICKELRGSPTNETFNCVECDFSLCFQCATLPQKMRYKHDKHMLFLSYVKDTRKTASWCEICEEKIDTQKGFYVCDEDCCVTLHIRCMIGNDLYKKLGSSWFYYDLKVDVVPNKQQMTRPICSFCKRRCPKASFKVSGIISLEGSLFCSTICMIHVCCISIGDEEQVLSMYN